MIQLSARFLTPSLTLHNVFVKLDKKAESSYYLVALFTEFTFDVLRLATAIS